jgi:hypothetical protein
VAAVDLEQPKQKEPVVVEPVDIYQAIPVLPAAQPIL